MRLGSVRGRKFILSPKVRGRVLGICMSYDTFVLVLFFCPTLRKFLVNHVFCIYFRKLLVTTRSADITNGYTDTAICLQTFLISRSKFSYLVTFSAPVLGRLCVKGTAISTSNAVLFSLQTGTKSGPLTSNVLSVMLHLSQHKIMLADSSTGSGLYEGRTESHEQLFFFCMRTGNSRRRRVRR